MTTGATDDSRTLSLSPSLSYTILLFVVEREEDGVLHGGDRLWMIELPTHHTTTTKRTSTLSPLGTR